jgi:hypothetical protein
MSMQPSSYGHGVRRERSSRRGVIFFRCMPCPCGGRVSMGDDMGTGPPGEWALLVTAKSRRRDAPCPYGCYFFGANVRRWPNRLWAIAQWWRPNPAIVRAWRAAGEIFSPGRESVPLHAVPMWRTRVDGRRHGHGASRRMGVVGNGEVTPPGRPMPVRGEFWPSRCPVAHRPFGFHSSFPAGACPPSPRKFMLDVPVQPPFAPLESRWVLHAGAIPLTCLVNSHAAHQSWFVASHR